MVRAQVVGIALVRDEADIIERTIRYMATQVDALLVADNLSTDGTRGILDELSRDLPLVVQDDPDPAHWQARKTTALARQARRRGAHWVVPFDADEHWATTGGEPIAEMLRAHPTVYRFVADLLAHVPSPSGLGYREREPTGFVKVACRTAKALRLYEGNHTADYGNEDWRATLTGQLVIHHFPYRSPEQFVAKVARSAASRNATDLPHDVGHHLRDWGTLLEEHGERGLENVFWNELWAAKPDQRDDLTFDPGPCRLCP